MSHNNQRKIAFINDFTGFGKCSITVALPVISALKVQCCPVLTSVFSNHTAYPEYFFEDYTDKMQDYIDNWKKLDLKFEGISSGFLGSVRQIEIVKKFINDFKDDKTVVVVDPVMGDDGIKYKTYTNEMCEKMKELVAISDIITPNLTECCILTDTPYREDMNYGKIKQMAEKLSNMGPSKVVITGIVRGQYINNYVYQKGNDGLIIKTKVIGETRSGTGDIFSAIIAADAVNNVDFISSVKKASGFIKKCIEVTNKRDIPPEDGVCFEDVLKYLK
ncbi:MAG: pyridoxamine kinase [Lachnospiraceae bacterium]|nr:pyridoxamine kinase [Lachnospiraceae bacterium]